MFFYDLLLYSARSLLLGLGYCLTVLAAGRDSPVNRNFSRRYRQAKRAYRKQQRDEEAALGHRHSSQSDARTLTGSPSNSNKAKLVGEKQA